jgi:predicted RNase H-like nuclease (RuvC/YqgF family)
MSNHKGNGIVQLKEQVKQLVESNQNNADRVKELLIQNTDLEKEVDRLKKLSSNYGQVCRDCQTGVTKQEELSNQVDDLTYERDLAIYGLVMILVVTIGKVLIWGF